MTTIAEKRNLKNEMEKGPNVADEEDGAPWCRHGLGSWNCI